MKRLAIGAVALLALTGCGGPDNRDPRDGRVVIDESNCWASCYIIYKVCQGPDLVYHDSSLDRADRIVKDSPACEVDQ